MHKLFFQIVILLLPTIVYSQSFDTSKYTFVNQVGDGLYLVGIGGRPDKGDFKNTKIGFVAENGRILLAPIYSEIGEFVNGLAFIRDNDKYGYINDRFNIVIPCIYSGIGSFNEYGLVWVNQGGKTVNPGCVSGGKFGVLDYQGRVVVPVKYKALGTFDTNPSEFGRISRNKSVAGNKLLLKYAPNYNVYDYSYISGKIFQTIEMPHGPFIVCSPQGNGNGDGIYDNIGNVILPESKYSHCFCPTDGFVPLMSMVKGQLTTNYYDISNCSLLLRTWVNVDCITPFEGRKAILTIKDGNVIIDRTGNQITRESYSFVIPSETGNFVTSNSNGFGMVDSQGNEVFPCCFNLIYPSTEGLFLIMEQKNGLCGFINAVGDYVITPKYSDAFPYKNGYALVKSIAGWGVIDKDGKEVLDCIWQDVIIPTTDSPDRYWVKPFNMTEFICIDTSNQTPAFITGYRYIYTNYDAEFKGVSIVGKSSNKWGVVAKDGTEIIPMMMGDQEEVNELYKTMLRDGKSYFGESDIWRYRLKKKELALRHPINGIIDASNWDY